MEESKESREPRQREKITLDTVIPPLPPKAERLAPPDEDKYQRELKSVEGKISRLNEKKTGIHNQIKVKKEGGKMDNADFSVKEFITSKVTNRKELAATRNKLRDELDSLKQEFYSMIDEQKKIRPKIKIFSREKTEKLIEEHQYRIENTSLSLQEEKKLIAELSALTASVPLIGIHDARAKRIDENKARQEVIKAQLTEISGQIDKTTAVIEETTNKRKTGQDQLKQELPLMFEETKKIQEEIKVAEEERKKIHEDFREKRDAYNKQQNQIKQIEWMTKMKEKLVQQEERKKRIEEEEKLAEENKPHPYANEILSCDAFIAYLNKFVPKVNAELNSEEKNKNIEGLLPEKALVNAKETEEWFGTGQKKQKKKRVKKSKKTENLLISPPIDLLNFFSYYGLKVPTNAEEAQVAIEELEKKKTHWEGLETRESDTKEERKNKSLDENSKNTDLSFNPVNFPAPEESKAQEKYGIFVDEGPVPVVVEQNVRGKRGKRKFK